MSKTRPPQLPVGLAAASTEARSRVGGLSSPGKLGKTSRLVRYPTQSNALRALLDDTGAREMRITFKARAGQMLKPGVSRVEKPSPSERSKPSAGAVALILSALKSSGLESPPAGGAARPLPPRIEPIPLLDGAALGNLVRTKRLALKLTQQQLAEHAGVGRRFVSELEAGKPTIELGKALAACQALDLTLTAQDSHG